MELFSLLLLSLFSLSSVWAQQDFSQLPLSGQANRATLVGTWVSQSQGVITGPDFVNPLNFSFNLKPRTGVSYSFTSNGWFEEAWYRYTSNGSTPNCVTGVVQWQHGRYYALANGSLILDPIAPDGRQQVQDTCASVSNIIQQFNVTVLMRYWEIRDVPSRQLLLYQFDGQPVQPLYPFAAQPIMLPTQTLTANVTIGQTVGSGAIARAMLPFTIIAMIAGLAGLCVLL